MDYAYLLDTNIISDLMRHPSGPVFKKISEAGETSVCTSILVVCELRFGIRKRQSQSLEQRLEDILARLPIIPFSSPVEHHYAEIRAHLEEIGTPIGPNDMLIAAQARSLNLTVVTANIKEFSRVPTLKVENWL